MPGNARGALNDLPGLRPSRGIPKSEQEAERRLQGKQWPRTSVMRGCTPLCLQWSGGPASGGFLFTPLLSGETSVPYKGAFVPSPLFFWPTFNPLSLLLFLPLVSVAPPKQNTVETMTIYSSPCGSALALRLLHGCVPVSLLKMHGGNLAASRLFASETEAEDENALAFPIPGCLQEY